MTSAACTACHLSSRDYCSMLFWASFDDPVIFATNEIPHSFESVPFCLGSRFLFELDLHVEIGSSDLQHDLLCKQ